MGTVTHPPSFDNRANIVKDDLVTTIEAGAAFPWPPRSSRCMPTRS